MCIRDRSTWGYKEIRMITAENGARGTMNAAFFENEDRWTNFRYNMQTFLESPEYTSAVDSVLVGPRRRLSINLDGIRKNHPDQLGMIFNQPARAIAAIRAILAEKGDSAGGLAGKKKGAGDVMNRGAEYHVTFEGNFGRLLITPRGLQAQLVNKLIAVQGIITRMSIVRPKIVQSVHYCDETRVGSIKDYYDQYALGSEATMRKSNAFPTKDAEGRPLITEFGFCAYRDVQTLVVQEMPERAPTGLLPRSVEVILENDLVDRVKPGDRVQIVGVYKCIAGSSAETNAIFRTVLVATGVQVLNNEAGETTATPEDIKNIRNLATREDILEVMGRSLAPSIQGHERVKRALLLMLLGGVERNLENGTHIRGDLNLLMIGDPSTAKSQLLRHVMHIAPLAIHTTGRGSSGVGLTAAVTYDRETGERHLEAGAMVLADRGVVCVDEFDKMNDADRVALHEVMEQQTVTIAKAGIHTSLNARCSVLAAANPIYGEYQRDLPPTKNVGLPDSLLSRFDLIFVVLDQKDAERDRAIAERVTRNHRFVAAADDFLGRLAAVDDEDRFVLEPDTNERGDTPVMERYTPLLHGARQIDIVTQAFLKKYVIFAKGFYRPTLNDEAVDFISQVWTRLRQREVEAQTVGALRIMPLTTRTFETIIRLAAAHAKLRLSNVIERRDCDVAVELLNFALFGEEEDQNGPRGNGGNDDDNNDAPSARRPPPTARRTKKDEPMEREREREPEGRKKPKKDEKGETETNLEAAIEKSIGGAIQVSADNTKHVFKSLCDYIKSTKKQVVTYDELWEHLQKKGRGGSSEAGSDVESREKMIKILIELENSNKIMINQTSEAIYLL
eukprot:TRINITY_DN3384_c0_g1_i1.p1 TRINITY_DN3384_c0_g1~~TRINITY_DN3384_c0_g1_i1.p1  ORF type:complete len:845 (+),score=264.39 TRINITY_DN3384_c0_g1_i1:66-2600(+)